MRTEISSSSGIGEADAPAPRSRDYKTVIVNAVQLAYVERGSGDAVIFVHGGISDLRTWTHQLPAFAERYRPIAYSRRYCWPNTEIPDDVDDQMLPHVEDLAELIRSFDAAPAHLVGNSWGGFICLLTALRHPELVRSLTAEEPAVLPLLASNKPKPQELLKLFTTRPRTGLAMMSFFMNGIAPAIKAFKNGDADAGVQAFALNVDGRDFYEARPDDVKEQQSANWKTLRNSLMGAGLPAFSEADARSIKTPTLLVTADKSHPLLPRLTRRLGELLPNVEQVNIHGAPHIMHYAKPDAVNRSVLDFIARH